MELTTTLEQIKNINNNFEEITGKINVLEKKLDNTEQLFTRPEYFSSHDMEYKEAFNDYLRQGLESDLLKKSLTTDPQEAGAVIVPALHSSIISAVATRSPMRQIASIETISTNALDVIIEDGQFTCGWIGEAEERDPTNTPKLKQKRIAVAEVYAQPMASQKLIDDANINIENWLVERLSDSFVRAENNAFILGDGDKKPKGFLLDKDIKIIDAGTDLNTEMLLHFIATLEEEYLAGATFLMNRQTLTHIQGLKDNTGRFIWQPALSDSLKQTIFGIPVLCASDMPDIADTARAIALGDFRAGYKIVDRSNISIMRDPYTNKPFVKFYAVKRVGGDVVNPDAIKIAQFKA